MDNTDKINIQYAEKGIIEEIVTRNEFLSRYINYFDSGDHLIDQEWCEQIINGMVRCYLTLDKVVGFGYQEINALYPNTRSDNFTKFQTSKRYYFTETCGLFKDLKVTMENEWVPQLIEMFHLSIADMPIIWDADFFINDGLKFKRRKYILCEINVSSVSPFPDSAIMPIIEIIKKRI